MENSNKVMNEVANEVMSLEDAALISMLNTESSFSKDNESDVNKRFRDLLANINCTRYAVQKLNTVLYVLGIKDWVLGGSVAGVIYGVDFGRRCHDIDVIVPKGTLSKLMVELKKNPFIQDVTPEASYDEKEGLHFAFKVISSPWIIDVVECIIDDMKFVNYESIKLASPQSLLKAKLQYTRIKDEEDAKLLEKLVSTILPKRSFRKRRRIHPEE